MEPRGGLRRRGGRARGAAPRPEAQASIYAFDVVERRIKRPTGVPDAQPRRIQRVGVVGAGLMATQLATLFLRRLEVPVVLTDVDPERAGKAVESIRGDLAGLVAKGRLPEGKARFLGSIVTAATGSRRTRAATSCSRRCSRSCP